MPDSRSFAPQLRDARLQAGLTQAALAEMLGVAQITLRKWEAGDREPPAEPPLTQGDVLRFIDDVLKFQEKSWATVQTRE